MEDALALAACLHEHPGVEHALAAYETERKPVVESTQRAAQASLEWFENIGMYAGQDPATFCFNLITRSRRITFENLKDRDAAFAARMEAGFARSQGLTEVAPAMFQPVRIGALELKNRIIVSPMDMYSAADGLPDTFHLVHLGSKALGGAGLVMTEMVCVSPEGRITPGCTGLWTDAQRDCLARGHRVRARPLDRQDRPAARPLRPQGVDPADVGRHGPAARGRQLGGDRALRRGLRRRLPAAPRGHPGRISTRWWPTSSRPPGAGSRRAST